MTHNAPGLIGRTLNGGGSSRRRLPSFSVRGFVLCCVLVFVPFAGHAADPIKLFGTVEFRGDLKNMPKWERVVKAEAKSPTFNKDLSQFMTAAFAKQWTELETRMSGSTTREKAVAVNAFFNRWPYRTDNSLYKIEDYWATPAEFMKKSGDCEDYAITKFYALVKLGVDPTTMRIVALKDTIRNLGHAVLAVYTEGDAYILDNLTDMVMSHTRYKQYAPQFSLNQVYRWAHVVPKKK